MNITLTNEERDIIVALLKMHNKIAEDFNFNPENREIAQYHQVQTLITKLTDTKLVTSN